MKYTPDLTTLDTVRAHRNLATTETGNDAVITQYIHQTSIEVGDYLDRVCMPFLDTRTYDYDRDTVWSTRQLHLSDDLLAITTLTNGDGATVSSGSYVLRPANEYPKHDIHLTSASGLSWTYTNDRMSAFSIVGTFGYVPHYDTTAWQDSGIDIPAGDLTSSATSVTVSDGTVFEVLQYIRVNSEVMQITAISTNDLTLSRGELGTTAAAHSENDDIEQFHQHNGISWAVMEMVVYRYLNKDSIGQRTLITDSGTALTEDLDPMVIKTLKRHRKWAYFDA